MAEVDNLLDFSSPTSEDQSQIVAEPNTGNLLDFDSHEDGAIESQSALTDLETEKTTTTIAIDAEAETEATESQEQSEPVEAEHEADICEPVEETSNAHSPFEPPESSSEQQQQENQPIVELDSPTPADTRGMADQQQQQEEEDASAAIDFGSIQSADGHSVAHTEEVQVDVGADANADVDVGADANADVDVDTRADPPAFDNRQYEVESSGSGVAISLRPKSEHDWSTSTKAVAMQYNSSSSSSTTAAAAAAAASSQSRSSFNGSPSDVCRLCQKKVYPMEMLTSDGSIYHKSCYRCHKCNRLLSVGNFGVLDNQLYCQPHYLEIFRIRGHYQAPADRPQAEIVGGDNQVDDGLSQVQKLSDLKSRFESAGDSSVVVTPPAAGGHSQSAVSPARSSPAPSTGSNGAHSSAEVVRSGEAALAEGELPPPGASKNVLAMFRNMEMGGQHPARDEEHQPTRQKGPSAPAQRRPYQPEPNLDFDYTAPVRSSAESESQPAERPPDLVRSGDPNPADEMPPANFTRSALQMWKDKEGQGGGRVALNPEASERLRQRARETSGINNNIRLPGAASAAAAAAAVSDSGAGDAPETAPSPPRDESSENRPSTPPTEVARWGGGEAGDDEMPKQGTTQNLRSMFSGGQ